jgi:hypothetical protein
LEAIQDPYQLYTFGVFEYWSTWVKNEFLEGTKNSTLLLSKLIVNVYKPIHFLKKQKMIESFGFACTTCRQGFMYQHTSKHSRSSYFHLFSLCQCQTLLLIVYASEQLTMRLWLMLFPFEEICRERETKKGTNTMLQ